MNHSIDAQSDLPNRIAAWVAVTSDLEIPAGPNPGDLTRGARSLRAAILSNAISPDAVIVDDGFKHVVSAAVSLLREAPHEARLREADALYQFVRRLDWESDPIGERQARHAARRGRTGAC